MYQYLYSIIDGTSDIYKVSSREHGVGMATPAPHIMYNAQNPELEGSRLLTEIELN